MVCAMLISLFIMPSYGGRSMEKDRFKKLEIYGIFFTFTSAVILHLCYSLSSGAAWAILFASVNDSVWEHIKIFALPYLIWMCMEFIIVKIQLRRFIVVKVIGLYAFSVFMVISSYLYIALLGASVTLVNFISYFIWTALAYIISCLIMISDKKIEGWFTVSAFLLVLFIAMYLSFTVNPPHMSLFRDPITNLYGIIPV